MQQEAAEIEWKHLIFVVGSFVCHFTCIGMATVSRGTIMKSGWNFLNSYLKIYHFFILQGTMKKKARDTTTWDTQIT